MRSTRRDEFIKAALAGLSTHANQELDENTAKWSIEVADTLLEMLEGKRSKKKQ